MRILHVFKDYAPVLGGIENHIRALAEAQAAAGHSVQVLATNRAGRATVRERLNGVEVIKAGRWATIASTPLSLALPEILRRLRPDITHLQSPYPVAELAQLFAGAGRPYVVSYQADVNRLAQRLIMLAYGPLFQRFLRGARRVIASNPNFLAHSPALRAHAARAVIIPIGIQAERFAPAPRPPGQPFTLLFVGQLRHYKGVEVLLQALQLLSPAPPRLRIVGQGPMRAKWEEWARTLGVTDAVEYLGRVSDEDLPGVYRAADAFVLPSTSRAESYGTVLLEAMASGLPCLTTEIGSGTSYLVQHEISGLVVPPNDPGALAAAIRQLAAEPEVRRQMGLAGRARVLAHFTQAQMIDSVMRLYEAALRGG